MVLTEQNNVSSNEVVAEKIISKIQNMPWLKNSADSYQNRSEATMVKGKKSRAKYQAPPRDAPTSDSIPGTSRTAWDGNEKTGEKLFSNAIAMSAQADENDIEFQRVLEESKLEFELSQMTQSLDIQEVEDIHNKSDEENHKYWNTRQSNLPSPKSENTEKPSDTNNNSSGTITPVAAIQNCPQGRYVTGRNNGTVEKRVQKIDEACSGNVTASSGRGKVPREKFDRGNNRQEIPMGMGRGGGWREPQSRMNQQKFQGGSNSRNVGNNPESESYDSRRNEHRAHNNRESTYREFSGYSHNTGQESFRNDKYHYVRNQSQPERESPENSSRNKNEIQAIPEAVSYESPQVRETLKKNLNCEETAKLRILKNDKKLETNEVSAKQQNEKLRLQGFHSRENRPPPDDEIIVPSSSKPVETDLAARAVVPDDFSRNLQSPQSCATKLDAPPGFHNMQSVYNYNKAPIPNLASNSNSQNVYENLAIHDPLLHRLLKQKQQYDYLSEHTNRQEFVGYENYQLEEEKQQVALQPSPISEQQSCVYSQNLPPHYVFVTLPQDPKTQYVVPLSHNAFFNNYHPHLPPSMIADNSLSSLDYVDNGPNVQMASEDVYRMVTPRGTAPAHRPLAQMVPGQLPIPCGPYLQQQYVDGPRENLTVPNCSLPTNRFHETPGVYFANRGMQQFANLPSNPSFKPVSRGFCQSIPRPCGPQFPNRHLQRPFSMEQYAEANNIQNQHFEYSRGNPEIPPNGASSSNPDPRRMTAQQMSNTERGQERLPQMR